jgi:hypothetical protein
MNRSWLHGSLYILASIHGNVSCLAVVTENVLTAPLPINELPLVRCHSGFQPVLIEPLPSNGHIDHRGGLTCKTISIQNKVFRFPITGCLLSVCKKIVILTNFMVQIHQNAELFTRSRNYPFYGTQGLSP